MVFRWLREVLGINQQRERLNSIESRLDSLESVVVRDSELELLRKEVEGLRDDMPSVSKKEKVRKRIVNLVDKGVEKSEVRRILVEDEDICSESYFYENWNYLRDASFLKECDGSEGFEVLINPSEI